MMNLSINQILNVWDRLHACRNEEDTFGSHTCEIYTYTLMEHNGHFASEPTSAFCREEVVAANKSLYELCKQFEQRHTDIKIVHPDGKSIRSLLDKENPITWRHHLMVVKKK